MFAESFRRHHPDGTLDVLLIEAPGGDSIPQIDGANVIGVDDIGIDPSVLGLMAMMYDVTELATAVKPWLLRSLLDRHGDHAVYFDPDIVIARPISELPALARESSIVLTPHCIEPMPRDFRKPSEQDILLSGVFNLGFIGVGDTAEAREFLDWWSSRLERDCVIDHARGFFVDQRFVDYVPCMFPHHVVRDPSWNVAYWNLPTRELERTDEGDITVNGRPLTFYHFSAYSPTTPHLLSKHQDQDPRILLSERPIVREMCDDYAARLRAAGWPCQSDGRVPFDRLANGWEVDGMMRRVARSVIEHDDAGIDVTMPPSPFDAGSIDLYLDWLTEPNDEIIEVAPLGRYLGTILRTRHDIATAYPEMHDGDIGGFLDWVELFGIEEESISRDVYQIVRDRWTRSQPQPEEVAEVDELEAAEDAGELDDDAAAPAAAPAMIDVPGVEVAGYFTADLGIGEAARQLVAGLDEAEFEVSTKTYARTSSRLGAPFEDRRLPAGQRHDTSIICVNADMLQQFARDVGPAYFEGRRTIGFWFWETTVMPPEMLPSLDLVDEVWLTSEFVADVIRSYTDKPVHVVPLPVRPPHESHEVPEELGTVDTFTFLFVFDYLSIVQRKNPDGLIKAFMQAFPEPGTARLVIKSINGNLQRRDRELVRYLATQRPDDIVLIERYLSREELDGLMWRADCYASLHRAEGFGLTMAETMAMGKPVIGTGYSGNLAFMDSDNSMLVDYEVTDVPASAGPYPEGAKWAEPDVEHAAELMRSVYEDQERAAELGARAKSQIAARCSPEALATFALEHLRPAPPEEPEAPVERPRSSALRWLTTRT